MNIKTGQLIIVSCIWACCIWLAGTSALASQNYKPVGMAPEKDNSVGMKNEGGKKQDDGIDKSDFYEGYELFEDGDYKDACLRLYSFVKTYSPDISDYEWAEFFLGVSLKKAGYSHASADILANLIVRKPNTKIMTYCLEIFEDMIRKTPCDRDMIINSAVCGRTYDFVDDELSSFIHYYQGIDDWKHGYVQWANEHFKRIKPASYYYSKYRYQKALHRIYTDEIDHSVSILREVLDSKVEDNAFMNEARKTLARLFYEQGKYRDADQLYIDIINNSTEQPMNLMERAWAHYRLGNPEKAMGLLYAFKAPVYRTRFTPEYYILKSFIYKDVCHYESAMNVVSEFRAQYGPSIKSIYHREGPEKNDALLLLILNKENVKRTWKFIQLLEREKEKADEFGNSEIRLFLKRLYELQIDESRNKLKKLVKKEYDKYADEMLRYEEEAHLMAYEIGIDMYQRVHDYQYTDESALKKKGTDDIVIYPFQDEFWDDELGNYKVTLPNKCNDLQEWDIFFK